MNERILRLVGAALAGSGLVLTAYLLYVRETGAALVCSTGGCTTVQSSKYAELLGLPVAGLGLAAYGVLLLAAVSRSELARLVQAAVSFAAVAFSAYLLYIQFAVIDAVCEWCVVNDVVITAVAATALLRLRLSDSPAPSGGRR